MIIYITVGATLGRSLAVTGILRRILWCKALLHRFLKCVGERHGLYNRKFMQASKCGRTLFAPTIHYVDVKSLA